jgi:hypothetical protein
VSRTPTHRYVDPLDQVWLGCAARVGFRVVRSAEVYASTDGRRTLLIGSADLDADDCLAQMIFHELCHSLIEGHDGLEREDWGLDNTSNRDVPREHACLRLQAHLAGRYGLRGMLAPTTDFRGFYDALPDDPLAPRHHPEVTLAILGLRRADKPPWGPHVADALAATAAIAGRAADYVRPKDELPPLHAAVDPAPDAHPTGLPPSPMTTGDRCAGCAWRFRGGPGTPVDRCRQADNARIDPNWPACARFEPPVDCQACGACCRAAYHSVTVSRRDPVVTAHPYLINNRGRYLEIARRGDRCAALEGGTVSTDGALEPYRCVIYDDRPKNCREFENGGAHCLTARRRVGLSL